MISRTCVGGLFGALAAGAQDFLEPVEVTASRLDEMGAAAPGSEVEIPREVIERSAAASVGDLLESEAGLPSLSYTGDAGFGTPLLRGFAENASSRTLILVDGLSVNRSDLGAVSWLQFPLNQLESISVLKGSRTVRYGSAALGGVISLRTREVEEREGMLEAYLGSDGLERQRASYQLPLGGWSFSLQGEQSRSDGYRQNSGYDSSALGLVIESPREAPLEMRWTVMANELRGENPGALTKREFQEDPRQSRTVRFGQAEQFFTEQESLRVAQQLGWGIREDLDLEVNASWFGRTRKSNFGPGSHSDNNSESWAVEGVFLSGENLEAGMRWQRDDTMLSRYQDLSRRNELGDADLRREIFGAFVLARAELRERWSISGGVGWESYRLAAEASDALAPTNPGANYTEGGSDAGIAAEAALEYKGDGWKGWMRYDRVYRFPVMDEIAGYQGFVLAEPFNAELEPEKGHSLEVGFEKKQDDWGFSATLFSQWLNGEIAYDFTENLNVNFSDTRRSGVELMATWATRHWQARASYSGTFARYQSGSFEGNRVPLVPEHIIASSVTWAPRDDLALSLEGLYVGASPEGNDFENKAEKLPDRLIFNTSFNWEVSDEVVFFLRVNNFLDRQYATLKFQGQWYPAAGRQLTTGLRWKF